jgi:hypothetical protein
MHMIKSSNSRLQGKRQIPNGDQRRYTGEILRRTRPKTYRAIATELAEPNASVNGISRRLPRESRMANLSGS